MRIDPNATVHRILGRRPWSVPSAGPSAAAGADSLELSSRAEDLRVAFEALRVAPVVREDKVAELRRHYANGPRADDVNALAARLLESAESHRPEASAGKDSPRSGSEG